MRCQLDYLAPCNPVRLEHALNELPTTLDETYERALGKIEDVNWEDARRLLQCIAVASRPLRVEELADILAFDYKAGSIPKFRKESRLTDPAEAVLSTCPTLLSLVNVENTQVVQFAHFSVKEFLTSTRFSEKRDTISSRYYIPMTAAHTVITQACLGMLLGLDENITRDSLMEFPLAEYAAKHWFEHARVDSVSKSAIEGMKQLFDRAKPHFSVWLWICDPSVPSWRQTERAEKPFPPHGTPLHYAALCGLCDVVTGLAIDPKDVNSQQFDCAPTPSHFSSREGYVDIARILVQRGTSAGRLHSIGRPGMVISISHGSSSSMAPMRQPRTSVGGLRSIGRPGTVISILHSSSSSTAPTRRPRTSAGRLRSIGRPKVVTSISHSSSSSSAPTRQPRTRTGRLHSIWRPERVISISHGFSSITVPTWQPRTSAGRLRSLLRPEIVISILHGSSSSMAPTRKPRTSVGQHRSIRRP